MSTWTEFFKSNKPTSKKPLWVIIGVIETLLTIAFGMLAGHQFEISDTQEQCNLHISKEWARIQSESACYTANNLQNINWSITLDKKDVQRYVNDKNIGATP